MILYSNTSIRTQKNNIIWNQNNLGNIYCLIIIRRKMKHFQHENSSFFITCIVFLLNFYFEQNSLYSYSFRQNYIKKMSFKLIYFITTISTSFIIIINCRIFLQVCYIGVQIYFIYQEKKIDFFFKSTIKKRKEN